jgi:hypothetical protein
MHSSIKKAYEILERREQQERAHEQWRDEHADELGDLHLAELRAQLEENRRVQKAAQGADLIFKTNENGLVVPADEEPVPSSDEDNGDALGDLAEEIGAELGRTHRELHLQIQTLRAEVQALRAELSAAKVVPIKGHRDVA